MRSVLPYLALIAAAATVLAGAAPAVAASRALAADRAATPAAAILDRPVFGIAGDPVPRCDE